MSELDKLVDAAKAGPRYYNACAELAALRAENEAMRRALAFYAHAPRYGWCNRRNDGSDSFTDEGAPFLEDILRDGGKRAREALAAKERTISRRMK